MIRQVPIIPVIKSKILLQAYPNLTINDFTVSNNLRFSIKPVSFNRVDFDEIDEPTLVDSYLYQQNGSLWLLELLVKNLGTETVSSYNISSTFVVIDSDDYIFDAIYDDHITHNSKYSIQSGLRNAYFNSYPVNVESTCMLLFYLPNEDDQEYFLYNKGGYFDSI